MMEKKYFTLTYGCQMNESDTERINGQLEELGYAPAETMEEADIIIMNTCSIRQNAEEKVYGKIGEIKKLKDKNPHLLLGIAGCMAQENKGKLIERMPIIDFVIGPYHIHDLKEIVSKEDARGGHVVKTERNPHSVSDYSELRAVRKSHVFAWIPIMQGCNKFCTYCIVPYVRGRERSRRPEDVVAEVREAVAQGYKEVTLLGQNVNSYGKDHKLADFADLLKMVDEVPGIERVRFMTSHPKDLSDKLIETIAHGKHICEHIHLPVQYGSDKILSAMHRIYTVDSYRALVERIRKAIPHVALTTDLIVGFPGETDDDFAQMLDFLREIRYDSAYTFSYSKRSGTPAAKMEDQVPDALKHERLEQLMAVQNDISREINDQFLDTVQEIMVEGPSKNDDAMWSGRTRTNKLVIFPHGAEQPGDFVNVKITHPQTWVLKGERV